MTPAEDFFKLTPPPLLQEFPESHQSGGGWGEGGGYFMEQPNVYQLLIMEGASVLIFYFE